MIFTLIVLSDIKFGTCRCCFLLYSMDQVRLNLVYIVAPGTVSASERAFLPINNTRSFHVLFVNKEI